MALRLSALCAGHLLHLGRFLVLISVRGWVDPRIIVWLKGLGQLKIQWPHRELNPWSSSLYHSASTNYGIAWPLKREYTMKLLPDMYKQDTDYYCHQKHTHRIIIFYDDWCDSRHNLLKKVISELKFKLWRVQPVTPELTGYNLQTAIETEQH
jgi:hypothetical protein